MRNLKRVLSLTLASVMLLGMMVIGTSAADYPDVDDQDNVEAIDVLGAVGIMEGYETGNFQPDRLVTRAEMAAIMSRLMNLNTYVTGSNPFTDVPSWAEGYVSACYVRGIIKGYGNGKFGTEDNVTAVQAAAMLMRALGYFQYDSDYADGFEVATIRQAGRIGLFDNVGTSSANDNMSRNQIAQLVLNTLQSGMVEADSSSTMSVTTPDGFTVAQGQTNYVYMVARDNTVGRAINETRADDGNSTSGLRGYILDLGEQLYNGELRLNHDDQDVFGRPARTWEYNGQTIGTYYKDELILEEYTTAVSGKTLYELLGSSIVDGANSYNFRIYMDGLDHDANDAVFEKVDINRNNDRNLVATGRGVLTQVFVDNSKENANDRGEVTITMINTYLAVADSDYNEARDRASFDVYYLTKDSNKNLVRSASFESATTNKDTVNVNVSSEDIPAAANVEKDEVYLVTVAEGEIQSMAIPDVIEETAIQAFDVGDYVEVDSNRYNFAKTTLFDIDTLRAYTGVSAETNLKENRYNVYLDAYGNAIGVEIIDPAKNYVFITGVDASYSFLSSTSYKVNGIFLDGTMETMTIDAKKSSTFTSYININVSDNTKDYDISGSDKEAVVNTWCTYTVNSAGVYTLKRVASAPAYIAAEGGLTALGSTNAPRAQYHDTATALIDYRNYSMRGDNSGDYARVYSDDETVFLTVSTKDIQTEDQQANDILIKDVDGVAVGIDNVDITVWSNAQLAMEHAEGHYDDPHALTATGVGDHRNISYGSYVLYGDDGYIIAAVVVGDDGGVGSDFVYVYDTHVREQDLGEDKWQWSRDAIVNGELVSLLEVNDHGVSYLNAMEPYKWYRVTYKSDGTVSKASSFRATDTSDGNETILSNGVRIQKDTDNDPTQWGKTALPTGTAATVDVRNIEDLIKDTVVGGTNIGLGKNTVVYHEYVTNAKPYVTKNATLHVFGTAAYNNKDGVRIDKDAKIWFRQTVNNTEIWDDGIGPEFLEDIIKELKEVTPNSGTYNYDIAALIENARATTVIVYDRQTDYTRPSGGGDIIGLAMDGQTYVETINKLLADGNDVTITTPWEGLTGDGTYQIRIPGGRTLKFLDDLNLTSTSVASTTALAIGGTHYSISSQADGDLKANLIVNGRFIMNPYVTKDMRFNLTANALYIWRDSYSGSPETINIRSTVRIKGDGLNGGGDETADLGIANNMTVDVLKGAYLYLEDEAAGGRPHKFLCI